MKNVRVWFKKTGTAKYVSHLDLARCMSRALKLSKLPIWYTEGFNPRIYMTFAMPLSLGVSGERECMDIRLTEDTPFAEVAERLNAHLPRDIHVFEVTEPEQKFDAVEFADYEIVLETADSGILAEKLKALLSRDSISVLKHTKKGEKEFDIKPHFAETLAECAGREYLRLALRLPCSAAGSVNPGLLLDALKRYEKEEPYAEITRKRLLTKDFSEIR